MTISEALERLVEELHEETRNTGNDDEIRALIRVKAAVKRTAERVSYGEWEERMGEDL